MRFADIIGHGELKAHLRRGVDAGRVSHAQLLSGDAGCGPLPLALAYAQYVNCTGTRDGDSCGECPSCHKMASLQHPDLHFLFPVKAAGQGKPAVDFYLGQWRETVAATGGYFDEQRWYEALDMENQQGLISQADADEIIRKMSFKAFEARYKVVIIWLPEKMREGAANTLLKILEEPWDGTLFLLVSQAPSKLLPTILSRTQEVSVGRIAPVALASHLESAEGVDAARARQAARLSGGDLVVARRHLSGEGGSGEMFALFVELMRLSYNDKHLELLEWAENAASMNREEQKRFLAYSVGLLRNSYMLNAGMDDISYLWGEELGFCRKFAPYIGNHNIEQLVREIELAIAQLSQNGNSKLIFAHFALVVSKLIVRNAG